MTFKQVRLSYFPFSQKMTCLLQDCIPYPFHHSQRFLSEATRPDSGLNSPCSCCGNLPLRFHENCYTVPFHLITLSGSEGFRDADSGKMDSRLYQQYLNYIMAINQLLRVGLGSYTILLLWEYKNLFLNNRIRNGCVQ